MAFYDGGYRRLQEIPASGGGSSSGAPPPSSVLSSRNPASRMMTQSASAPLSGQDLKELYNPRGHMPQITFSQPAHARIEASRRIAVLDAELQERVQSICDRLSSSAENRALSGQCCRSIAAWCSRHLTLGIIREIIPHLCFYVCYSMGVSYYASKNDWEILWTAAKQDAIYYPAVVLAFLLCFRASGCMERYNDGLRTVFQMERCLREVAFETMTKLSVDHDLEERTSDSLEGQVASEIRELRRRYFKHEFRRLVRVLFTCAARDLNDSALQDSELDEEEAQALRCSMTKVEHAAVLVTHSAFGHAFRVYLASSWLLKLVKGVDEEGLFDGPELEVYRIVEDKLAQFKSAWLEARQVAYSSMPGSVTHILWLLTTVMSLFMPWEWVSVCQWSTWWASVMLTISFYGILQIASGMENPFGFDSDDIQISEVAEHLDEEVCLTMHYAILDEFGGENLYRSLMGSNMIFLDEAGLPGSEGLAFLADLRGPSASGSVSP